MGDAVWRLHTRADEAGAVALFQIRGDVAEAMHRLGIDPVDVGAVALRDLAGVDTGLVTRPSEEVVQLMPHGGRAILERLSARLDGAGLDRDSEDDPSILYPEASSPIEAKMLDALARARSPLAIDLLLDQPRFWSAPDASSDPSRDAVLRRLIDPPVVVIVGPSNVGKSTLLNALAGHAVALVADEPGTTRDHVGAMIDLAGLVVRLVDSPGRREGAGPSEAEALDLASSLAGRADLVLSCGDARQPPGPSPRRDTLVVATRADLGSPGWPCDVRTSAHNGAGLGELVAEVRERLVPAALLAEPRPWRFWD